jgi:hypothetical protein
MFEPLVALAILAGQQGSVDVAPQEHGTVVVRMMSADVHDAPEFMVEEKQMPQWLYLPYDSRARSFGSQVFRGELH